MLIETIPEPGVSQLVSACDRATIGAHLMVAAPHPQ